MRPQTLPPASRRAPARFQVQGRLRIAPCARASIPVDLTVLDMSSLGMLAAHPHEVPPGTRCELSLRLPPSPAGVRVHARVVWTMLQGIEQTREGPRTVYRSGFEFVPLGRDANGPLDLGRKNAFQSPRGFFNCIPGMSSPRLTTPLSGLVERVAA